MEIVVVDAFTAKPFAGNPAAVVILDKPADEEWMKSVAREMNLSETAFLERHSGGSSRGEALAPLSTNVFAIRWLTPTVEVALCGHATLASAHRIFESGLVTGEFIEFDCKSGKLLAERLEDGWIRLDFPSIQAEQCEPPDGLLEALGTSAVWVGKSKFDYLVEVSDEHVVRGLEPIHSMLQKLPVRGVMVTARGKEHDFVSRFFAPGSGIDEDPVTGSAHCALTPYWAGRLGKDRMQAYQASPRGGTLRVEYRKDRVYLEGQAVTVWRGELLA